MLKNININPFFAGLFQIGFVTRDIDKAADFLTGTMGTGKFMKLPKPEISDQTWNGEPIDIVVDLAFGQWGNLNIELIQPIEGESSYSETLQTFDWIGIHHICVKVHNVDEASADMAEKNIPLIQSGRFGDHSTFHYFDTRPFLGYYTEVLYFDEDTETLFDKIARNDF